jgi:polyhydroxybutyrate depolymerase
MKKNMPKNRLTNLNRNRSHAGNRHLALLKLLSPTLFAFALGYTQAQTTVHGSFIHGGINRTYSFYVPASYVPGNAVPLVIGLHGTSSSGEQFAQHRDFRPIADTANFIMVHPDGSTLFGVKFWNYGNVLGSTVDDVGFLEALIDTISAQYTVNPDRIYCTGMSNGSFMCYALACQSNRFAAIAGVTGSMSVNMYNNCNPLRPIPTMHIHGTEDGINPYPGNSTMKAIEAVTLFWVNQNNCDTTPIISSVPDNEPNDEATAEHYLYANGIHGHTIELFKVIGGEHTWPGSPMPGASDIVCMDFDARAEIWRFFSQYEKSNVTSIENQDPVELLSIYPNPAQEYVYIQSGNHTITNIVIVDMQGRVVERHTEENIQFIALNHLKAGSYRIEISGKGFYTVKKLIIL